MTVVEPVVARGELNSEEWPVLEPLLPAQPMRGGQWRDHRQVVNAICWVKRTGSPGRDLPERYGPGKTARQRFTRWAADGTWVRMKTRSSRHAKALAGPVAG
jgi:transposase